jgi:hypothetical protein
VGADSCKFGGFLIGNGGNLIGNGGKLIGNGGNLMGNDGNLIGNGKKSIGIRFFKVFKYLINPQTLIFHSKNTDFHTKITDFPSKNALFGPISHKKKTQNSAMTRLRCPDLPNTIRRPRKTKLTPSQTAKIRTTMGFVAKKKNG